MGAYVTQRGTQFQSLIVGRSRLLGASWVREEFTASRLHAAPDAPYSWGSYDRVVDDELRNGLHVLGLLDYSNTWGYRDHAVMRHRAMPRLSSDFARYAAAVVRHFRGRIAVWEVWNEPDISIFWRPHPNPDDYALLLRSAYSAIKGANPQAQVMIGGTSGMDLTFLQRVAARAPFDIVSVHPYRAIPEKNLLGEIQALRSLHRPIWFSEIGWPSGGPCDVCVDGKDQARYLVRFYSLAAAAGVERVFWYDLRDDAMQTHSPEAHFGLLRQDLSGKTAFAAYEELSRLLAGSTFLRAARLGSSGLYALRFQMPHGPLLVAWNLAGGSRTLSIRWPRPGATLLQLDGGYVGSIQARAGRVTLTLPAGTGPVYLVSGDSVGAVALPAALIRPAVQSRPSRHPGTRQRILRHRRPYPVWPRPHPLHVARHAPVWHVAYRPHPSHPAQTLTPTPKATATVTATVTPTAITSPTKVLTTVMPTPEATSPTPTASPSPTATPAPSPLPSSPTATAGPPLQEVCCTGSQQR